MNHPFRRILGFNLAALLLVASILRLLSRGSDGFVELMAYAMGAQLFANVIMAFAASTTAARQAHWLSLLLVLLIGFGVCAGSAVYY